MSSGRGLRISGDSARARAAQIVLRLHQQNPAGPYRSAQELLDQTLPQFSDSRDAGLCTELGYGALRQEIRLEWLLGRHLTRPEKLPLAVRVLLLCAAYELLHLDRIPAHATVNLTVELVRKTAPGLTRLANAVLRSLLRLGDAPGTSAWYAEQVPDPLARLSVEHSVPPWIVKLWQEAGSLEYAEDLAKASGLVPWPALRVNMSRDGWQTVRETLLAQGGSAVGLSGVCFVPGRAPQHIPSLIEAGQVSWQGAGTQKILEALGARDWPGPVWDACAGRGGKSCALLEMGKDVRLASDPHPRIRGLAGEAARLALPVPECREAAAQEVEPFFTPATIVLDAPCSGLGTLARRPDVRLNRRPEHITPLVALQRELIDTAWRALPRGGKIVYITCTVNPAENEAQTQRALRLYPEAVLEKECRTDGLHGADIMYGALLAKE